MALKTGERMRRYRVRLGLTLILSAWLSVATTAYGESMPFAFYKEGDNLKYLCHDSDIFKYARMTQIGRIHLSIKDFDYGSGDARTLGVFFDTDDLIHSNAKMYDKFVQSVRTHNRSDDRLRDRGGIQRESEELRFKFGRPSWL